MSLVRPHLEYSSSAWDPHLSKHVKQIEMVQRRGARFVKNEYKREPGTVTQIMSDLQWQPLYTRRKINRLSLLHKAMERLLFPYHPTLRSQLAQLDNFLIKPSSFNLAAKQMITNIAFFQEQ